MSGGRLDKSPTFSASTQKRAGVAGAKMQQEGMQ